MTTNRSGPQLIVAVAVLGLVVGCAPPVDLHPTNTCDEAAVICPDGVTIFGIDVSYWQGNINWNSVANDGVEFAFIRVADGHFQDPDFAVNWSGAQSAGVIRGAYQYFRPGQDAVSQANLFLADMGPLQPGDLPPVLDVETDDGLSDSAVVAGIHDWIDTVEFATGVMPIIYTSFYSWQSDTGDSPDFAAYPMWVANWQVNCPNVPAPWNHWEFWQTSDSGSVSGIGGAVDTNEFNGDLQALLDFAGDQPVCGDGICNGAETPDSCPQDCPACDPIPYEGRVIDDEEICFVAHGPAEWWHHEDAGHDGHLVWTYTTDEAQPDNYAVWDLEFETAGEYLLEAYTPAPWNQAQLAAYQVHHQGSTDVEIVAQSDADGWNPVGTFAFAAGGDQWVRLDDNTGEPYNGGETQIVVDAIRLTRTGGGDDDDSGDDDSGDDDAGDDDGSDDDDGDDDAGDLSVGDPIEGDGCACSNTMPRAAAPGLAALLALLFVAIRRRIR